MSVTVRVQAHQNYLSESAGVKTVQSSSAGANVCVCVCIYRGLSLESHSPHCPR